MFCVTAQTIITQTIATSSDDAEEAGPGASGTYSPGTKDFTSSDIELTKNEDPGGGCSTGTQKVGLRFTAFNVPSGAIINSAFLTFGAIAADVPNTNTGATNLTIKGKPLTIRLPLPVQAMMFPTV